MGYWPSVRLRWLDIGLVLFRLLTDWDGVKVNKQSQQQAILTELAWSIKDLLYGFCTNFSCGTQRVVSSGQDSFILPAHRAKHIVNGAFDLHAFHSNNSYCYIARLSLNKMSTVIDWFLVMCLWENSNVSRPGYNCAVVALMSNFAICRARRKCCPI